MGATPRKPYPSFLRDYYSQAKEGLPAAKARGQRLGRPQGAFSKSKLDDKAGDIRSLLQKHVSKASIARIMDLSPTTLHHFIRTRKLQSMKSGRG
jgi:DNA invertase Pin-like site-specific DNA recombinase